MVVDFVVPISYQGVSAFVRADDMRFDNALEKINDPSIKVSAIDGGSSQEIPETFYPKAQLLSLPQLTEASQQLLNVVSGKADVTFTDRYTVAKFQESNPNTLREVVADYPVNLFGNPIAVYKGEYELKQTLDNATIQLMNVGIIERILKKYEKYPNSFYRPALSYQNK
jgi:ABC-type amino acid transport substrate-binding protein